MSRWLEWILSLEREQGGLSVDPGETWIHEKEVLTKQILLLIYYIYYINQNAA